MQTAVVWLLPHTERALGVGQGWPHPLKKGTREENTCEGHRGSTERVHVKNVNIGNLFLHFLLSTSIAWPQLPCKDVVTFESTDNYDIFHNLVRASDVLS